jgi:hypothetical protein
MLKMRHREEMNAEMNADNDFNGNQFQSPPPHSSTHLPHCTILIPPDTLTFHYYNVPSAEAENPAAAASGHGQKPLSPHAMQYNANTPQSNEEQA